jgi:membrane-bound serine protease (ClpP class)
MFDRIMLKTQITGTAGGPDPDSPAGKEIIPLEDEENLSALVGKIGVADSVLRPSGKAVIDDKVYSVEADNEFVDAGRGIIVTRVRGSRIIVRRV